MKNITDSVYYTGVLNPNMRVFDVIMRTEYGTSYNSYIVTGSEKTAVIEAAHKDFGEWFECNVKKIVGERKIDYLVLNHTEPDHTGCVVDFIEKYPEITIVLSPAAAIYIKNITNRQDLNLQIVKDGDSISLGDKTLSFINAPFLHWPDSMFTYLKEEKVLFTCDFLGCHFCEPQVFDSKISHVNEYWQSVKYYYDCIFAPFAQYVQSGLKKIEGLEADYICTSHGPVLTKDVNLKKIKKLYGEWSSVKEKDKKHIPLFYCTAYGNTAKIAEHIQKGILQVLPEAQCQCYNIIEHDMAELAAIMNESDAFLLGTLTINKEAVPPVWDLVSKIEAINIPKRPVALFGSFGWSGEGFTHICGQLKAVKANVFEEQFKVNFVPSEQELNLAVDFGVKFANTLI